jgi:hypothetical protein
MTAMVSTLAITLGLLGQVATAADDPAVRLAYMKRVLERYQVHSADGPPVAYRLKADPAYRFTNPVGFSRDGAVFLWRSGNGRPAAAVQISLARAGHWFHDVSSLSERPLVLESADGVLWTPRRGGVELRPIPGAPAPAATPEQRLRQMRTLAAGFRVEDNFRNDGWQKLRMFSAPASRYGEPGTNIIDGALYTFVLTTDPEAFLVIEARQTGGGPQWQYALAPMTIYALRASLRDEVVWSLPHRPAPGPAMNPTEPFFAMGMPREP